MRGGVGGLQGDQQLDRRKRREKRSAEMMEIKYEWWDHKEKKSKGNVQEGEG